VNKKLLRGGGAKNSSKNSTFEVESAGDSNRGVGGTD